MSAVLEGWLCGKGDLHEPCLTLSPLEPTDRPTIVASFPGLACDIRLLLVVYATT